MSYLLRVELPDVPGSLGRVATAIGLAGGNIEAIEIVEHGLGDSAVDDVFVRAEQGVMPDAIVSALHGLDGVRVLWISRYAAGANLTLDLEAVEEMTLNPANATNQMVDLIPETSESTGPCACAGTVKVLRSCTARRQLLRQCRRGCVGPPISLPAPGLSCLTLGRT